MRLEAEALHTNARFLGPLPARMLRKKLLVCVRRVGRDRALPILVFRELREPRASLSCKLARRMKLEEVVVCLLRIRRFCRFPVDALATAAADQRKAQQHRSHHDMQSHHAHASDIGTECGTRHECGRRGATHSSRRAIIPGVRDTPDSSSDDRDITMSEPPKRRLLDEIGTSPTFVADGCTLTGDLETNGPIVVCGTVRGDGRIGGALRMSAQAAWIGEVHAHHGIIAGQVTGKLVVAEKLEIGATAVIRADVVARSIAVAKGAVIEGQVTVTSGEAVIEFEEKRAARRTG
jgi:cytoskeletal protein CcmA (bactofilin family)